MNNKQGWRKGFGFAQIMAMIVVVIPVTILIITLLFDYWAVMQLDNRLKLMCHRAIMAIDNNETLSTFALSAPDKTAIASLCPTAMPNLTLVRVGDLSAGQTRIEAVITDYPFNRLGNKTLHASIVSYSYRDQNGSFKLECKG